MLKKARPGNSRSDLIRMQSAIDSNGRSILDYPKVETFLDGCNQVLLVLDEFTQVAGTHGANLVVKGALRDIAQIAKQVLVIVERGLERFHRNFFSLGIG